MDTKPSKRGDYVTINGTLYPVTGSRQIEAARQALRMYPRASAAITHWNGSEWTDTGRVFYVEPSPSVRANDKRNAKIAAEGEAYTRQQSDGAWTGFDGRH